jgi:hypothetical protein
MQDFPEAKFTGRAFYGNAAFLYIHGKHLKAVKPPPPRAGITRELS